MYLGKLFVHTKYTCPLSCIIYTVMVTDINEITNLITQLYPDLPYPTFSVSSDEDSRIL